MKLKNYFQIGIGAGLVIAFVAGLVYMNAGSAPTVGAAAAGTSEEIGGEPVENGPDMRLEEDLAAKTQSSPTPSASTVGDAKVDMAKASQVFAQSLKQMAVCVNMNVEPLDQVEPTAANLLKAAKTSFGDPIMNSVDTIVWSLRASGEERRIRIETDYSDSENSTRNLRYFKLDKQGTPSLIPLPPEQTKNPTDALIASLQKDGTVYQEEKSSRAYFERGQEMTMTEKDNNVDDFAMTNGSKTYRCSGVLTANSSCKCE